MKKKTKKIEDFDEEGNLNKALEAEIERGIREQLNQQQQVDQLLKKRPISISAKLIAERCFDKSLIQGKTHDELYDELVFKFFTVIEQILFCKFRS